ncbi:MAG: YitT family protein [Ruminococcus sp.]|nr:YitT family protein [Ruminococcus sp.]
MNLNNLKNNLINRKISVTIFDYAVIAIGAVIYAVSVVMFTAPNNIAPGGVTAIGTMLNFLFGTPIGAFILIINIPLFIWGGFEHGKSFLIKTVVGTVTSSVAIDVLTAFLTPYKGDTLLACIFGGILNGVGNGLIFYRGGSTAGTDIIALNIHKRFPHITTGYLLFIADILILIGVYFVYSSVESVLYAVVAIYVSIRVIDLIDYGTSRGNGKLMFIITNSYADISKLIMETMDRGITLLNGEGAYRKEKKKILMCAVRPQQVHRIISCVKHLDPNAFIVVTTANAIRGEGFVKN